MVPTEIAKQKQPMLRLFLSAKSLEHLVELGFDIAAAKLDAKAIVEQDNKKPPEREVFNGADRETRTPDPLITNLAKHLNLLSFKHLYLNVFFFTGKRLQEILLIVNLF